jgi:outer membrane protein insertion porin family
VPIFDRLYLGGSNNLRGFNFRDISPKDFNKQPIGGQSLARGTVELTFPIVEKARGAVFYDVGFVNPDAWDFSQKTLSISRGPDGTASAAFNSGVPTTVVLQPGTRRTFDNIASDFGVGIRLDLPIGPLRLDYGIPVQTAGNGSHGHLNFSVGYQF